MESQGSQQPYVTFNNGIKFPQVGLGTFMASDKDDLYGIVKKAFIETGYRHLDTASAYFNEEEIGKALKEIMASGIKREEIFVTTKLWKDSYTDVEGALKKSLSKLQLDYIDLYLIHWTFPAIDYEKNEIPKTPIHKVWQDLEALVKKGLIKSIGVSNATVPILADILTYAEIKPVTNQIELHPYLAQEDLLKFHQRFGIILTAYAPIGASGWSIKNEEFKNLNIFTDPIVTGLAEKHGKTPAQIILNWHLHRGILVIPKTMTPARLGENFACFNFKMAEEDYQAMMKLDKNARFFDPKFIGGYGWNNVPYFS